MLNYIAPFCAARGNVMLKGIGASQGYGIGNAVVISDAKLDYNHVEFTTAQNEKERLQKAVDTFIKETRNLRRL